MNLQIVLILNLLGASSGAIEEIIGGVVMITHNNEFCSKLCPKTWAMDAGHFEIKGQQLTMSSRSPNKVVPQLAKRRCDLSRIITKEAESFKRL